MLRGGFTKHGDILAHRKGLSWDKTLRIFNPDLVGNIILPGLLGTTVWSAIIAIAVGTVVGLIAGAIKRKPKQTILPAIAGSFFGSMVVCMLPILAIPGIVGGGAYGGIIIMGIVMVALPIGSIGGAIAGSMAGLEYGKQQQRKMALNILVGTYLGMALVIFASASFHCSRPNTLPDYCTQAGYPRHIR